MQRLFSNFANGWPGLGLLLQRILTAILLIRFGIGDLAGLFAATSMTAHVMGLGAGFLILVGLCTPIVGILIAVMGVWLASIHVGDPWVSMIMATLGGTVAMIGPGSWSIDARLFGRKHLEA